MTRDTRRSEFRFRYAPALTSFRDLTSAVPTWSLSFIMGSDRRSDPIDTLQNAFSGLQRRAVGPTLLNALSKD